MLSARGRWICPLLTNDDMGEGANSKMMSSNIHAIEVQQEEERINIPVDYVDDYHDNGVMNVTKVGRSKSFDYINNPGDARYIGVFVGFLVVVLGAAGNGVTVWAYTRNKNLQTSFNVLIANLCLVDLIFSIVVVPSLLPGYVVGTNIYPPAVCSTVGYLYYVSLSSSLYNLVAIAVNRYVGIVRSKNYQKLFTGRRLALCIASVWVIPAVLYLPLVIGGAFKWTENSLRCAIGDDLAPAIKWYNLSLDVVFQTFPLGVLIYLYTAIFRKVKQVKENMKVHKKISRTNSSNKKTSSSGSSTLKHKTANTSEDSADELKPSSLLDGLSFKPVPSSSEQNLHNKLENAASKSGDETEDDLKSTDTALDDRDMPVPLPGCSSNKRNSIWALLSRNRTENKAQDGATKPCLQVDLTDKQQENSTENESSNKQKSNVTIEMEKSFYQQHRKLSLSAPNLAMIDFSGSEKVENNAKTSTLSGDLGGSVVEKVKLNRTFTEYKKEQKVRPKSAIPSDDTKSLKETWPRRIKRTTMEWASNISLTNEKKESQTTNRVRFGTIAKRVQDRKAKEEQKQKKRQRRNQILRKKHARERQLVYSSFTICIAFALCIMPTALLYLIQVLSEKRAPASANLIVGCVAWLHAVVNPMIYGYLNTTYRREYSKIAAWFTGKLLCRRTVQRY